MALSDLELLSLVDGVKEAQRGPMGPAGVGIESIEQYDGQSFTIRLTDGSFRKIALQPGADGETGPQGIAGPKGEPGPAGRAGRDGSAGAEGAPGLPGKDGTSVDTAVVNLQGHLLLGLTDGSVIDVGRVLGPAGASGEPGPAGLPGEPGRDGAAVLSGPRAPQESDGEEGDHWIDISSAEFGFFKKSGGGWEKLANLRQPARDMRVGAGAGGGEGGGPAAGYTTSNLPMTGLGRSADSPKADPPPGGISKPGGNIIPEAKSLRYQSNFNRWAVASLDALDEALPINKVDKLPVEGKYDGDMVLFEGALWIYSGDNWIEVGGAVDVSDFALKSSVQRVEDNLDLVQETVGAGKYTRVAKPGTPVGPGEGEACFLQDGGAEATTFAEVENIQLNKTGIGPYADFTSAKKGDYLLLQSAVDGDFGLYVIRNATEFGTFWDFGLEISSGKAVGTVPEIDEGIIVRTSRPTFTVAQDTPPDFSATGQLWFDTAEHQLKVWDDEAQEFVETAGGAEVHVGEDPPADAAVGDLWYCTKLDDLTLYVLAEAPDVWAAAAPPVSLEGLEEDTKSLQMQVDYIAKTMTPAEAHLGLYAKVEEIEGDVDALKTESDDKYLAKTGGELTGKLETVDRIWVRPGGKGANGANNMLVVNQEGADTGSIARFQQGAVDILKIEHSRTINACGNNITDVANPTADKHAANKEYVDSTVSEAVAGIDVGDGYIATSGTNRVSDGWKIESPNRTHFHVEGSQTKIYWLQDPDHAQHPVTMGWANNKYADKSSLASYLPLSGGKLTGNLSFGNNARIDCNNGSTVLSGRGCFELRANADRPLIFSSGSGSKKLLSFYGYDGSAQDNKSEKAYITAGGEARFTSVYSSGKELATKEYVDANAGGGGGGAIARTGSSQNPSLVKGELYLRTTDNALLIGI